MYNPGNEKTVIIGFEAPSPSGDIGNQLVNKGHPYISGFTVLVNCKRQDYTINYFWMIRKDHIRVTAYLYLRNIYLNMMS